MNLRIFSSREDLASAAADALIRSASSRPASVIALSGGSTPRAMYTLIADRLPGDLSARKILWVLQDERDVPIDHEDSNAGMILRTLFRDGMPEAHRFLFFDTRNGAEAGAAAMEILWSQAGSPTIDLAVLGAGPDGHTASLFPGTTSMSETTRAACAVHVPRLDSWRMTLTLPVLSGSREQMVLVAGADKRAMLDEVRAGADLPITKVASPDRAWWFVDEAAHGPVEGS